MLQQACSSWVMILGEDLAAMYTFTCLLVSNLASVAELIRFIAVARSFYLLPKADIGNLFRMLLVCFNTCSVVTSACKSASRVPRGTFGKFSRDPMPCIPDLGFCAMSVAAT